MAHARAIALVTLNLASAGLAAILSGLRTAAARVITVATAAISLLVVQTPVLALRFHVTPLHANDLGAAVFASVIAVGLAALLAAYAGVHRMLADGLERARARNAADAP